MKYLMIQDATPLFVKYLMIQDATPLFRPPCFDPLVFLFLGSLAARAVSAGLGLLAVSGMAVTGGLLFALLPESGPFPSSAELFA